MFGPLRRHAVQHALDRRQGVRGVAIETTISSDGQFRSTDLPFRRQGQIDGDHHPNDVSISIAVADRGGGANRNIIIT
jgi:hypothetical protein